MSELRCPICATIATKPPLVAREMMFGTRENFSYLCCDTCGCWSLMNPPADMSRFYPKNYYSFQTKNPLTPLRAFLKRRMGRALTGSFDPLGQLLNWRLGPPFDPRWFTLTQTTKESAILDVGCGNGVLLLHLQLAGFKRLHGIEPFLEHDLQYPNGVTVKKQSIAETTGSYDLVMLHHVFEHMADPKITLQHIHRLLNPGRFAVIRIPVADSYAATTYGENWVQLDAPRHLFLHTKNSIQRLADETGFDVAATVYDSNGFQFWGSEQYQRDIPLNDPRSHHGKPGTVFTKLEMQQFEARAQQLNAEGKGDAAAFFLRKK